MERKTHSRPTVPVRIHRRQEKGMVLNVQGHPFFMMCCTSRRNGSIQSEEALAEYRMWGNGIALPCARYVMTALAHHDKEMKRK